MKPGDVLDVCGGYRLLKRLGTGGFAEVWQVESLQSGINAALKYLNQPSENEESQREMQSLEVIKNVRHPYLLQTWAYAKWNEHMVIIMDLADGSLRDRLKEYAREHRCGLPADELIRYFFEAAEALDYLHNTHNIIHRDIKPDNLMLRAGHIVVCDFGLVRIKDRVMMSVSSSGTPAYMAPEIWHGHAGAATDQYALAATYAELRLNRRPFQANDYAGIMIDHLQSQPLLDPMPAPEQQVILRAMAKEPSHRYPSCVAMVQALAEVSPGVLLSRRFGSSTVTPASAPTVLPGAAQATMMRPEQHTMQQPPQPTNLSGSMPSRSETPGPSSFGVNTPSSVHGLPTQFGAKSPPPAQPGLPATLGFPDGSPPNLGQSLNPNIDWGDGPPPGSGSFQTDHEGSPPYTPPSVRPGTQPGVSLPSQPAYPPQPPAYSPAPGYPPQPSYPPNYPPQQGPYGVAVSGPDMFVEVTGQQSPYPVYPPPPPPPRSRLPIVAALIGLSGMLLLGTAVGVYLLLQTSRVTGSFVLQKPAEVKLQPGKPKTAKLTVQRKGYQGPLKLSFSSLKQITVTGTEIPAGRDDIEIRFDPASAVDVKKQVLTVTATPDQGEPITITWDIEVESVGTPDQLWLPAGFQAVGQDAIEAGGKRWHKQIEKKLPGGPTVVFVLVPATPPFYLMQDKVSNEVFGAYVTANPGAADPTWKNGGIAAGNDAGSTNGKLPVFRVTHKDAKGEATWLGGTLPTPAQFDFAATLGKTRGAAINRREQGPAPIGTSQDISDYNINDLAGNGWEWTSEERTNELGRAIVLRGQRYTARQGLTQEAIEQQKNEPVTCAADQPSPLVGFRVAITPP